LRDIAGCKKHAVWYVFLFHAALEYHPKVSVAAISLDAIDITVIKIVAYGCNMAHLRL